VLDFEIQDSRLDPYLQDSRLDPYLGNSQLRFCATDVKYLIVRDDKSIPKLYRTLAKTGLQKDEIDLLKSRVLTVKHIKEDV
jgi:hypothetical protein